MQYTDIFSAVKIEKFIEKNLILLICSHNIDCWYTLEPARQGGSNQYPQSMFWIKDNINSYTPEYPSFTTSNWGSERVNVSRTCFPDDFHNIKDFSILSARK